MTGKQLKNSILQWAIQGKLVPQDPNDEPASVLLEKIRAEKARLIKEGKIKKDKNESIIFRGEDNSYYEKFADGKVVCIDEEIPFEIPESWEWCRLGEIISISSGDNLTSRNMKGGYIPVFGGNGITGYHTEANVFQETIVIGRVGYYCGSIHITPVNAWVTDNAFITKYPYKYIDREYLVLGLRYLDLGKSHNATAQPVVSAKKIYPMLFPLPPLAEQYRIVAKIEELMPFVEVYDKAQTELDTLNAKLPEALKKSILQEAIQGKLVPQDPADEPASALLQRIKEEKLRLVKEGKLKKKDVVDSVIFKGDDNKYYEQTGKTFTDITDEIPFDVPNTWTWVLLANVITLLSGRDLEPSQYCSDKKGIPYMTGASNFNDGCLIENRWTLFPQTISHKGDLLITCKGTIGTMAFNTIGDIHIARQIMAVSSEYINLKYLELYLKLYVSDLQRTAKSIIPGISRDDMLMGVCPLPPKDEQIRIVNFIEKIFSEIKG